EPAPRRDRAQLCPEHRLAAVRERANEPRLAAAMARRAGTRPTRRAAAPRPGERPRAASSRETGPMADTRACCPPFSPYRLGLLLRMPSLGQQRRTISLAC